MGDPMDELLSTAARLKQEIDDLVRKIETLRQSSASTIDPLLIAQRAVALYESRAPRPVQVTITQAAQMLGLSSPTVRKLMKAGKLSFNGCGLIPIEQVDMLLACSKRQ